MPSHRPYTSTVKVSCRYQCLLSYFVDGNVSRFTTTVSRPGLSLFSLSTLPGVTVILRRQSARPPQRKSAYNYSFPKRAPPTFLGKPIFQRLQRAFCP